MPLPFIAGGRSSIRKLRTRHAVVTGAHLTWSKSWTGYEIFIISPVCKLHYYGTILADLKIIVKSIK
jgi:hypothetical protein